ncbi:ROK family protein [Kitasatospora sp. NPDC048365]|uniref:ROK family transcriptional regulator n=1 Tax=Kitasatospora sp. NPDC048365 TaxID=3364050 RepID=UPI0037206178
MTPSGAPKPTVSVDANRVASVRRSNLGVILKLLRDHGPRSRSRLAAETALPKATVSTLIAELIERGLLREGDLTRGQGLGRPGQTLELDGRGVCGLGLEISATALRALAVDADGRTVSAADEPLDAAALGPEETLARVALLARRALDEADGRGVQTLRICLATPGTVDPDHGTVLLAAGLGWRDVPAAALLRRGLGPGAPDLRVENDAHAATLAEAALTPQAAGGLLLLTGESGVAAGVAVDGRIARLAGEVGHAALGPADTRCPCGRRGCWETVVGVPALLDLAADADDPVRDPARALPDRLAELRRRADAGDPRTLRALAEVTGHLCHGLTVLSDLIGPRTIVLGGYFAVLADHFVPAAQAALDARTLVPDRAPGVTVTGSGLGFAAAVHGAAAVALEALYEDPTQVSPVELPPATV